MTFTLKIDNQTITVKPVVYLYQAKDYLNESRSGLCVGLLYQPEEGKKKDWLPFCTLTKNFGEWIGIKNAAYIDLNNCPFATQLCDAGFAEKTSFFKKNGFCEYPLWIFKEDFLRQVEGEYNRYAKEYDSVAGVLEEETKIQPEILRTVYVRLEVDDQKAMDADMGTIEYLENEMAWLIPSGIHMTYSRILDQDDPADLPALLRDIKKTEETK